MTAALPASARQVAEAARSLGLTVEVVEMGESTRTAQDAAAACGCDTAQIVKSLVFRGAESGEAYLFLVSGPTRLDEALAASAAGEPLTRADPEFVRDRTGYAIGGVPPIGHVSRLPAFMDEVLLAFDTVWAAAGTPRCVFRVQPDALRRAAGARPMRMA